MSVTTCILYEIKLDEVVEDNVSLARAQHLAIGQNLPFAVIYFHPNGDVPEDNKAVLAKLQRIEDQLEKFNIPLMVFLGNKADRVQGINMHLEPRAIYSYDSQDVDSVKIMRHPVNWPGVVFSTEVLQQRILAEKGGA